MNVILSVRPTFCQSIFEGKKIYEYRRKIFKRTVIDRVYIYASKPTCRIVGYFIIDNVIKDSVSHVWQITHKGSGITKEYYEAYFRGCDNAYAIKIKDVVKLDTPIDPKKVIKDFTAPQNYMYVDFDL